MLDVVDNEVRVKKTKKMLKIRSRICGKVCCPFMHVAQTLRPKDVVRFRSKTVGQIQKERKIDGVLNKALDSNFLQAIQIKQPTKVRAEQFASNPNKVSLPPVCAVSTLGQLNGNRERH